MRLKGRIINLGLFGITKGDLRQAGRAGMKLAGWMWHRKFKGLHFQSFAVAKYGYTPRSRLYKNAEEAWGKKRAPGPPRPLVFSGESERLAMASNTVNVSAKTFERYRADVIINAPALNFKNKNTSIDMRKEVTTVLPSEGRQLESEFARGFVNTLTHLIATKRGTKRLAG